MFLRSRRRASSMAAPEAAPTSPDAAVLMERVTKLYDESVGVREISLLVPPGTILGIIGPSGAGKTTTMRLLTGALEPDAGRVRVLGQIPTRFRRGTRERIGYMPQSFTLYPDLTASENVDFVASLFGMLFFERRRRGAEVLRLVELYDARKRRAADLSGGMQRRLELACALVHDPTLLFLDEPTAGIDPLLRGRVWEELHRLRDAGRTLLVTTQYVTEAEECDAVALIADGRLLAIGTPDELRRMAVGGDVVEVETLATFDGSTLEGHEAVRQIRQTGPRSFLAIVDDAGTATPMIVDAVADAGGEVGAAREARPTFDEVFTELVERNARTTATPGAADRTAA
jgi:ABC-2 type transport system ATP-binding protein